VTRAGAIYGTPSGAIMRIRSVSRSGRITAVEVGGPQDGRVERLTEIPADWREYPS